MRITEPSKERSVKDNVTRNSEELQNLLSQTSSGKRVSKPSDDPIAAVKIQDFKTTIDHTKTLEKNIASDQVWVNKSEDTVKSISDLLLRVKTLGLQGANDAMPLASRQSIANELKGITENLVNLSNTKLNNLYMFSGTKTFTQPLHFNKALTKGSFGFSGIYLKSKATFLPVNRNKPLGLTKPSELTDDDKDKLYQLTFTLRKQDPITKQVLPLTKDNQPITVNIPLTGNETIQDVIDEINKAAIKQGNYKENEGAPLGFDVNFYSKLNKNNEFAIFTSPEWNISINQQDPSGLLKKLQIYNPSTGKQVLDNVDGSPDQAAETVSSEIAHNQEIILNDKIKATFHGYSNEKYLLNVLKGGHYGEALYIISDDGGKTWSEPKVLNKKIEVSNPDGKPSRKLTLSFDSEEKDPYFMEGLEVYFKGNEYALYEGNKQDKSVVLDNNVKASLNTNAHDLFFAGDDKDRLNVFETLYGLQIALNEDDTANINKSLNELDQSINQILRQRENIAKVSLELKNSKLRVQQDSDSAFKGLAKEEDLDVAKASMEINNAENRHQIALNTSAKLIQPTLLNFLR